MDDISRDIFDRIDANGSGEVELWEFRAYALVRFGIVSEEDIKDIDELFRTIDEDNSGAVTFDELESYYVKDRAREYRGPKLVARFVTRAQGVRDSVVSTISSIGGG